MTALFAQAPAPPASQAPTPQQNVSEMASQDTSITFQSKVNLVLVPVVVRDKAGKPVGNLTKDDFQIFDRGKAQTITRFLVERPGSTRIPNIESLDKSPDDDAPRAPAGAAAPTTFTAWFFDDVHLNESDLMQARAAAEKYLFSSLDESRRTAIYTSSGQTTVDFTDSFQELRAGLAQLRARPIARALTQECPDTSYYLADLIINKNDPNALATSAQETWDCLHMVPPQTMQDAARFAQTAAQRVLASGEHETQVSLMTLKDVVRRVSAMPGQRLIVMISPGFFREVYQIQDETDLIDRAIRANVAISALDARGLYTDTPPASQRTLSLAALSRKQGYERDAARADSDLLAEVAAGTGGTFIENSNDLAGGVRDLSAPPEVYYVLAFSPQNLKLDGGYHGLKVTLRNPAGLTAKARRGYYAPRHLTDADEEAKEEISQALFSREETRDIPVEMHTQFFKANPDEARLVVVTRLDIRKLHYRKMDGRNGDEMLVVSGLFDHNGNFLQAVSKKVQMRLKDETLATRLDSGISVRSDFKVSPGRYVVRLVVRDAEGQMMSAQNGAVEIP
ncbi:MAG TPA: VWA domain-containing protein [Bryobacteraceae bacterium]|nr:VWA domain-containing protein [Bryobacteraceae bacterium]